MLLHLLKQLHLQKRACLERSRSFPTMHLGHNYSSVITMCICQFQVYLLGSLWNSFMRCRFPLDRVSSGRSELLITCLISLELPLSPAASAVFYKDTHFPLEMPQHEMTSKEMAIPMRPASYKKKKRAYCLLSWRQNRCTKALHLTGNSFEKQIVFKIFFRVTRLHWCVFLSEEQSTMGF